MAGSPRRLLTIAGSDSGGGAGIQADLKAFAKAGAHGMSAITAVTAQNTREVTAVYPLPPEAIVEQVRAVVQDIGVDAVKVGMVGNTEAIQAVAVALDLVGEAPVVLDPVMVAESGARLLDEEATEVATTIWTEINEANLVRNILPTRERAVSRMVPRRTAPSPFRPAVPHERLRDRGSRAECYLSK